jgi:hypothetical protein
VEVARLAVQVGEETDRLSDVQLRFGGVVNSNGSRRFAALAKARSDLLKSQLGYLESQAELSALIGRLPR